MDSETSSDGMTSLDLHLPSEVTATSVQPDFIVISDSQPSLIDIDSMVPHEYLYDVTVAIGPAIWSGMQSFLITSFWSLLYIWSSNPAGILQ